MSAVVVPFLGKNRFDHADMIVLSAHGARLSRTHNQPIFPEIQVGEDVGAAEYVQFIREIEGGDVEAVTTIQLTTNPLKPYARIEGFNVLGEGRDLAALLAL